MATVTPTPANMNEHPVHLYQIAYSPESLGEIEEGYSILNNLANPRPDWFEYWPIRSFLLTQTLDDEAFYGFFSPKFGRKTLLSHAQVTHFVQSHAQEADVFLFSPQPDMGAFFLNVYEQAETFDAGFIDAFEGFLNQIGRPIPLRQLVMDSRQIVFSNYFVAKPAFWRVWLGLTEIFFAFCEGPATTLQQALTQPTSYGNGVQRKVFIMERIASLLLTLQKEWRTKVANPFQMNWSNSRLLQFPNEAFISDALKIAWKETQYPEYLDAYAKIRNRL